MADASKVKVGVCSVNLGGLDLGHTKGGVEVSYEPVYKDVQVDQYGETVYDKVLIGEKWTAKVPLAEKTIANIRNAIPQGEFAGAANKRMTIGHNSGQSGRADAQQLVLHPLAEGTRAYDIVFYKAYAMGTVVLNHKVDEETIVECEFIALIDETKSDGNLLGLIGDST